VAVSPDMKFDRSAIEKELIRLLRDNLNGAARVVPQTNIVADLGLESVQIIEYLCEVEDRFDLVIDEDSLADTQTIADLAAVVEKLAKQ
jgi:acyl carrier protein